ncbi:3-phosphoshikimate 1-carboxyvinyltransferase [Verrucomicrobiaceae bacterium N1E253]|uniref:Multifunctional fusion protein n=1 Tax=Oceaniferula marina TaxID=2748318 RepID=A0A851GF35_9BACT|nr:3-phosphoshikimate 1-carboxyvinyltransferase [Oceaniferula marina]NWK54351.1 3-phosphoshikimate 1-carboxyvinyltransferase [Oceaniferula marina]
MSSIKVTPIKSLNAVIEVPGDKSISHRAAIMAGLADGVTQIDNYLPSEDCLCTLEAMASLGVQYEVLERLEGYGPTSLRIYGQAMQLNAPDVEIDCGNSGTGMRLLAGVLAAQPFQSTLTGDESLQSRPMGRIMTPLSMMGARIEAAGEKEGCAPMILGGSAERLQAIHYDMPMASAQVKSAVLLAGLFAEYETSVRQPAETRDHTERIFDHFQIDSTIDGHRIAVHGGQIPMANDLYIPGDISSAAFWLVAAAAMPGAELKIKKVGLNPTRKAVVDVLIRMGADIRVDMISEDSGEPYGDLTVIGGTLQGTEILPEEVPNLIDEIPVLAVAGALAEGRMVIRNASELRVKESDRISTVVTNLRAMGAEVEEFDDGMEITGGRPLHAAELESYDDHRIAMSFIIAGLFAEGETVVHNTDFINTSYPGFQHDLEKVMNPKPHFAIAIDGPAASGKSTVARRLAEKLGLIMINTGAMYRAIAWASIQHGIDASDTEGVIAMLDRIDLRCGVRDRGSIILVDGVDAGDALREDAVNSRVSAIAAIPEVRRLLVEKQRDYLELGSLVMEGRDIGSVVFPDTPYKLYVDASEEVRLARRSAEGLADVVSQRDKEDSSRKTSPLVVAEGATVIDSSEMTIEEVVDEAMSILKSKGL